MYRMFRYAALQIHAPGQLGGDNGWRGRLVEAVQERGVVFYEDRGWKIRVERMLVGSRTVRVESGGEVFLGFHGRS